MQERQVAREYFGPPSIVCCYRCIYGDTIRSFVVFNLFIVLLKYTAKPAGESSNIPPLYGLSRDDTKQYVSEISRVPIGKNSRGTVRTNVARQTYETGKRNIITTLETLRSARSPPVGFTAPKATDTWHFYLRK